MDHTLLRVVIIPIPSFGHLIPSFQLSIALARKGVRVFFISTPRNIQRLPRVPPELSSLFNIVEFPFPDLYNNEKILPNGAEATTDTSEYGPKYDYLYDAFDHLQKPVKEFVLHETPDYIISDVIPWTVDIARECHVPLLFFSVFSSAATVFFGPPEYLTGEGQKKARASPESFKKPPEWVGFPSLVAYRDGLQANVAHLSFFHSTNPSSFDALSERLAKVLDGCQAVIIRSCHELEGNYLIAQEKMMMRKPVIPIGLLPVPVPHNNNNGGGFKWLDGQKKAKSVVFVGFGSECKLTKDEVHEIAYGLELSGLPFFWTLRNLRWAGDDLNVALPPGFAQRTASQGVVCTGWAAQVEILAHPSIGGAFFHAGWGTIIESLQFGHCLVVLPMIAEQPLNARLVVEKQLAVEVERSEDGSFTRTNIADSLQKAMLSEQGKELRDRAKQVASIIGDHKLHQDHYIHEFVKYLRNGATYK